ncbi:DUF1345 domain-containing protein [Plesiomonas shigelloides]|uniref:DUF1345 domain-containing protein n=1 Tax=Plesiomonas shigelloides TaxID=703 RepID=UPI003139EE2D
MRYHLHHLYRKIRVYLGARPQFLFSLSTAVIFYFALLPYFSSTMRLTFSWNIFAWFYIGFLLRKIINRKGRDIQRTTRREDESAKMVILFVIIGCCVSVLVMFMQLATAGQMHGDERLLHLMITGSTLLSSWLLLPMAFTMHYAHIFYSNEDTENPWLLFPDNTQIPNYWDFMYFSFTIAVASQTADVCIGSPQMRKVVLLQSVISFFFNMAVLGMSVNIGASLF